jgi:DUF4097 and DUF4098 domain-containing protein YvlB
MVTSTDEVIEQRHEVGPDAGLTVRNISGKIVIRAGDDQAISVRARKYGRSGAMENTRVEIEQDGSQVTVSTRSDGHGLLNLVGMQTCSVDYDITVPSLCEVHAKGVSADVSITGTTGPVRVESVSGDIEISRLSGECKISSVSGDVEAHALSGHLILNTTSGDVDISDSRVHGFNCHTVSGDLTVETPLAPGEVYVAKTVSGDLSLLVPHGTGATVQMKSVSGDVSSELPAEIIRSGRRHWQGRINGGGATVEMNTVSGDLRISASSRLAEVVTQAPEAVSSDTPKAENGPPDVTAQPETATAILQQLEQGTINVEQAMSRLKALR